MITDQKFFKNESNIVFCIDITAMNDKTWREEIKNGWTEISAEEARLIANPPSSQEELNIQKEAENIYFLSSEINRVETKLTQLYRLRDRNKASENHLSQIEELEDYSTDLMLVENQKGFPLKAKFPECPIFFKEVNNG